MSRCSQFRCSDKGWICSVHLRYTLGLDNSLRGQIDNFVASQKIIQQVSNPSGTVSTGGLGEPKFNIDETAFTDAWGWVNFLPRTQVLMIYYLQQPSSARYFVLSHSFVGELTCVSDGPALRANALITWANFLLKQDNSSYVTDTLWPIIKLDLDYVAENWNQTTYVPLYRCH